MSKITLLLYAALLVYYGVVIGQYKRMFKTAQHDSPIFRHLKQFRPFFFTGWNFTCQLIFLFLAISDELLALIKIPAGSQKLLNAIRSYFFQAIIFPATSIVFSVFWTFYFYNRELIFPSGMDKFYPHWLNLSVHAVIILPLIIESFIADKRYNFIKFKKALIGLTIFLAVYQILYFGVHHFHGVWVYPFYEKLTWPLRILFVIAMYVNAMAYLGLGIWLQDRKRPSRQRDQLKSQ